MSATDRALLLLGMIEMHKLATPRSKEYERWQNIKRGRARFGINEAETLAEIFPQYAYWILTGRVDVEAGHISPEIEEVSEQIKSTGTDTE
ncbi:hypothetical protein [Neptunomonas phycophila]|uniref:hypothetical protein n=1 Tax=Neptunomonas phycophila TaxID=1572645 RepID=UPI0035166077